MVRHPSLGSKTTPWIESRKKINIIKTSSGDIQSPMFQIKLSKACEKVFFSIHQKDIRCISSKSYIDFGVTVLQETAPGQFKLITSTGNSADRQNQTKEMSLPPGTYLVIPTSSGSVMRDQGLTSVPATVVIHTTGTHELMEKPFNANAYEEVSALMF